MWIPLTLFRLDKETLEKFRLSKGDVLFNRTDSFELVGETGLICRRRLRFCKVLI